MYWFKAFSKYNSFESYTKSASFFLILRVDSIIKYFGSQCCSELNKAFGIFTQNCFYTISFILSLTFAPIFNEASNELERTNSRSTFILISVYSELLFFFIDDIFTAVVISWLLPLLWLHLKLGSHYGNELHHLI